MPAAVAEGRSPNVSALEAYEALAPFYDAFTAHYEHERWLDSLEALAKELGLSGRRLLDAACGTGKSFLPMVERGYDVSACDLSLSMVERARARLPEDPERVLVADMRALPEIGPFDLVTCLDDAVNYLLSAEDLQAACASFARVLRPGGMLVFDCNTLSTYRTAFAQEFEVESPEETFRWRGHGRDGFEAGETCSARIDVLAPAAEAPSHPTSWHTQRHHPREEVELALILAGLELLAVRGQTRGARLWPDADEEKHSKLVYVARRPA